MAYRSNGIVDTGITAGSLMTAGVVGWVGFRLYVRQQFLAELEEEGLSRYFGFAEQASGFFNFDLNLPPPSKLARSMVPIWSTIMPEEALHDISRTGRNSQYWPDGYREPSLLARYGLEEAAFASLAKRSTLTRD